MRVCVEKVIPISGGWNKVLLTYGNALQNSTTAWQAKATKGEI